MIAAAVIAADGQAGLSQNLSSASVSYFVGFIDGCLTVAI